VVDIADEGREEAAALFIEVLPFKDILIFLSLFW
jgi:hypothetical protein